MTSYSKRQHNIDNRNRRVRYALFNNLPKRTEDFAKEIERCVSKDDKGNPYFYIWCQHGVWHAKAIRKSDGKKVEVGNVVFINVLALICSELGIGTKIDVLKQRTGPPLDGE